MAAPKIFTKKVRQQSFEAAIATVRKMFPDASEHFVFKMAQASARRVPVPPKTGKPRQPISVAQTYRAPTRAERMARHKSKMEWNRDHRSRSTCLARVPANLSRNHPDHGLTLAEHLVLKAKRAVA